MAKKKKLLTSILSILSSAIGGISNSNIKPKNVQELERKRANDLGEKYGLVGRAYANRTSGNESFRTTALRILNPGLGAISSLADASKQQKQAYNSGEIKKQTREVPKEEKTLKNTSIKSSNELQKYKEKNNINVFNENSKRVQNDKQYQKLLKQAQNDLNTYHDTQEKNIVESFTPEKGFVGQLQKGEYAVASGFSQGFEGIRNTTLKILGQTPTDRELKPTAMQQIQQKNRQNETNAISGAMQDMLYSYGQMMPQMALANMGSGVPTKGLQTATNLLSFSNYGGSAYQQARNEGYSDEQATRYGLVNGALETSLEKVLGGFESLYGKSATGKLTNTIMGKLIKNPALRKTLTSMTGEFTEEYLQEFLDPIVREALLDEDNGVGIKDAKSIDELTKNIVNYTAQNFFSKENLYAGILGSLNSGMVEAPANFTRQAQMKAQGRDFDTGFTKEEQARIDKLTDSRVEQAVKEGATDNEKLRNKIQKEVINDIYQGNDNILEIMQDNFGEDITNLTNKRVQYETLTDQINELQDQFKNEIDNGGANADAINNRIQELENQRRNLNYERDADTFNQRANEFLDKNYLFKESYNENQRSKQTYDRDISKYSKTQQESINEAQNYEWTDKEGKLHKGILDNSNRTASIVDLSSKIAEKIGAKVRYVNDSVLEQEGIIKKGRKVNGYNDNGEIVINLDSARRLEYTTGHEITHSLEGTDAYNKLQSYLKEFVGEKEWNNRKSQIEENYADVSGVDIDSEITSDLVGEYLFNNTEFINNLSTNKSLFNKIYNEIKYMYNLATAGSKEQRDLERLKKKFADALKNSKQEVKNTSFPDTRYSLSVKEANTTQDNEGRKLTDNQLAYFKDSKAVDENGNLVTVYHTTTDAIPQFNEFNPVGTEGYKYGDQVVNFFTNSKTMSGSYADYEYQTADTSKITDKKGVNDILVETNNKLNGDRIFVIETNDNGTYFLYDKLHKNNHLMTKLYKSQEELFKNIKQDLQERAGFREKTQYEGYVNITNPYIIDAEGANWDEILTDYDSISVRYANEISQEQKEKLIDIAEESKRRNDAIYDELKELYSKEWDIKKEYPYLKEEEYKKYLTKKDYNQWQKIQNRIEEIKSKQHYEDDYFRNSQEVKEILDELNYGFNMNFTDMDLYKMASSNFDEDSIKNIFGIRNTTNEIVKKALSENKYDGVIIKNVIDYGSTTEFDDNGAAQDVYVTFNSNQFKAIDNTNPTNDPDIRYSLTKNSNGETLSPQQQEYFKDSKVRDEDGKLHPVYHMTNADFNKIDFNKNYQGVFWFASSKQDLQDGTVSAVGTRDKANSKIMELYANITNPAGWREYENYGIGQLKEMGYDGVILKEDDGSFVGFVFNSSNQIKNVDNLNPTQDADIRYSLSHDSQGRELSEEQQEYFKDSKVRDENGNLLAMYHGTEANVGLPENEKFTVFDRDKAGNNGTYYGAGFYFTSNPEYANDFAKGKGDVYEVYLKMTNPYKPTADTINTDGSVNFAPSFYEDFENRFKDDISLITDWSTLTNKQKGRAVRNILQDNGYDGIVNGNIYVVFEPNQIKNIDNLTPTENDDIRYSLSENGKMHDNTTNEDITLEVSELDNVPMSDNRKLMAMHNLNEEKLNGILDLGGIPVPSIAITNPDIVDHNQFGEGTLIFNKSTIDPAVKKNEVYDRDVWSPTFPRTEYEANEKVLDNIRKSLKLDSGNYSNQDSIQRKAVLDLYTERIENLLDSGDLERVRDEIKNNKDIQYSYLKQKGQIEPVYKPTEFNSRFSNEMLQQFLEQYQGSTSFSWNTPLNELTYEQTMKLGKTIQRIVKPYYDEEIEKLKNSKEIPNEKARESMIQTAKDRYNDIPNNYGTLTDFIMSATRMEREGINKQTLDEYATFDKVKKILNKEEFDKWVDETFTEDIINDKGIRNDKDIFTPSGNRRSFKATHEQINLENLVKALTKGNTKGGQEMTIFGTGYGRISAQTSNRFNSIKDIKANENRLMTREQAQEIIEPLSEKLYNDTEELAKYYLRGDYKSDIANNMQAMDITSQVIEDFAGQKLTSDNLKKTLDDWGYKVFDTNAIPQETLNNIVEDLKQIQNMPTDYFEAKPQRAVGLDEIGVAVIPNTWSQETKQRMTDAGIEYTEYDPNVENARNDAIKSFDNLRFSLTQAEQNDLDGLQALEDSGWTELTPEEAQRKAELERKRDIETKYPELENIKSYKDLGSKYYNYQDLDDFNSKVLDRIKDTATGKKRNGKKVFTKDQWLGIAEMVGSNLNAKTSAELEKYAVQSWFSEHPNRKENLNREGKKYNRFTIDEWVNAVYKGAGVGEEVTQTKKQAPLEQILTENTPLTEQDLDDFERFNNERPIDNEIAPPEQETQPIEDTNQPLKQIILEKQNKSKKGIKTSEEQTIKTAQEVQEEKQNNKIRKFIESAVDSEAVDKLVDIQDLDTEKMNYVPISNKKTLDSANTKYDALGYDESLNYIKAKINDKNVTLDDIALAERLIQESARKGDVQTTSDLIMDTAIIGTELGQKVQALSIIKRLTPEGQLKALNKIVNRNKSIDSKQNIWGDVKITDAMAKEILGAYKQDGSYDQNDLNNRVENVKQQIADQMKVTIGDKLNAWRYLSMLGNPKTHLRNIISNVAMKGAFEVKNATARTIEDVFLSENRTKTWKKSSQVVKDFAKQMTQDLKGEITGEGKFNETSEIENERKIFKTKAMNFISDFNSNMLEGEDWFFSSRAFESTFREYLTAQGIKTQADIDNNPEIVQKGINHSIEQAQIATFRQYSKLASMINGIENKSKVGKLAIESVIPFKKTPINVAKAGLSYSPLGLIKSVSYDAYQVKTGNMEASTMIDHMAQGLTGTSLTLLGYALAKAGILKGSGGDDKDDKYDNYLGKQNYSINIGGQSFSLSWLSPVAMPLFVGVEAKEQLEDKSEWDFNVIAETLAQTLDPLNEMSFMQGLTQTLSGYTSGTGKIKGMFENTAQNYVLQFFPTLFSQIASTLDDKKRSTKADKTSKWVFGDETIRKIMYKIPGLRNQLEVSTDIWGNEQEQADNIITRAFESFISPTTRKQDISTGLDDEIKRVYKQTNEKGVIPSIPYSYINYNGEKYNMTSSEYTAYKKTYGRTANEMLNSLVASSGYQNATDEEKAKMIEDTYKYASAIAKDEFFSGRDVEYQNDSLTEYNELNDLGMGYDDIAEYTTLRSLNNSIKNNKELSAEEKRLQISNNLINSNLDDEQLAYAYSKYYGDAKTMKNVVDANIPIKEYIKFKSQDIKGDVGANGKTISGSRLRNVVKYVNSLNLTKVQKAMLIKSEYASYTKYDNLIFNYINSQNLDFYSKASLLRKLGFKGRKLNSQILDYIDKNYETLEDKIKALEDMGFKTYQKNGKTYVRS